MPDDTSFLDIPWSLIASTRTQADTDLTGSTVSILTYTPELPPEIQAAYPGERLIYFKFSVSIAPLRASPDASDEISEFLDGLLIQPVKRVVFDLNVYKRDGSARTDIRPYFIAAAPMRREMVESGVVGLESFSGESSAVAIGKSRSSMQENFSSSSSTSSNSYGGGGGLGLVLGPLAIGGGGYASHTSSDTSITGSRATAQAIDVLNRQASDERRDLLSHATSISNVLTLLSAHHIGSPYLRFSLWPTPLRSLTADPTDSNLWYTQLLQNRSNGIEGLQEFYAIVVAPQEGEICIDTKLKLVAVLQSRLLGQFEYRPLDWLIDEFKIRSYLGRRFPPGTPIEDLDTDFNLGTLSVRQPVVEEWGVDPDLGVVQVYGRGLANDGDTDTSIFFTYKTLLEVWLDTQRAEFENKLLNSPLVDGLVTSRTIMLKACSRTDLREWETTPVFVTSDVVYWLPPTFSSGSFLAPAGGSWERGAAHRRAVFEWNAMEDELTRQILGPRVERTSALTVNDPAVLRLALESLAALDRSDSRNLTLAQAREAFRLPDAQFAKLQKKGITDLKSLATSLLNVDAVERRNREIGKLLLRLKKLPAGERPAPLPRRLTPVFDRQGAEEILLELRKGMDKTN